MDPAGPGGWWWSEWCAGAAAAAAYAWWGLGRATGSIPRVHPTVPPVLYRGMVVVPLGAPGRAERAAHLHHWMLLLPPLLLLRLPAAAAGFAAALAAQGLCYRDRFEVLCQNPYHRLPGGVAMVSS